MLLPLVQETVGPIVGRLCVPLADLYHDFQTRLEVISLTCRACRRATGMAAAI